MSGQAPGQAAQGGGGIAVPGGVQETCVEMALWTMVLWSLWCWILTVDPSELKGIFQPKQFYDKVITKLK